MYVLRASRSFTNALHDSWIEDNRAAAAPLIALPVLRAVGGMVVMVSTTSKLSPKRSKELCTLLEVVDVSDRVKRNECTGFVGDGEGGNTVSCHHSINCKTNARLLPLK